MLAGRSWSGLEGRLPNVLPVADDWPFLSSETTLLANILDDEAFVSVLVEPIAVFHEGKGDVFAFFAGVDGGLVDFGNIDVECLHLVWF